MGLCKAFAPLEGCLSPIQVKWSSAHNDRIYRSVCSCVHAGVSGCVCVCVSVYF